MHHPLFAAALVATVGLSAQTSLKPYQESPAASVSQDLGISNVKIDYHSPAVKGRKIWGAVAPYGEVWRTGANDATVITFSHAAKVAGQDLPAGSYAFFAIPGEKTWTLIFNKTAKQWGAYDYKKADDALRIEVNPHNAPFHEHLTYTLQPAATPDRLKAELAWENQAVDFEVSFDGKGIYWSYLQATLAQAKPDEWLPFNQAAGYCLNNDVQLAQGLAWAEQSIKIKETPRNLSTKARLLRKTGKKAEALPLLQKAIDLATAAKDSPELVEGLTKMKADWAK